MEFIPEDTNISNMNDGCIFAGKADICKEFDCRGSSHGSEEFNTPNQSVVDVSSIKSIVRSDENDTRTDKKVPSIQRRPFVVSPEAYRTLLDNLYLARLWFLRTRNITMNQLTVYKEEAIEHMHEIKHIIQKELENPEASAWYAAQELVKAGIAVVKNQQALTRIEIQQLEKNLDSILNTLSSDVIKVKSLIEPEYEENKQKSSTDFIIGYGHWCLFVVCVFIVLAMGVSSYLPAFEEYFYV